MADCDASVGALLPWYAPPRCGTASAQPRDPPSFGIGYKTSKAACIPLALIGRDICGSAITGSEKTAAFSLLVLERLLFHPKRVPATRLQGFLKQASQLTGDKCGQQLKSEMCIESIKGVEARRQIYRGHFVCLNAQLKMFKSRYVLHILDFLVDFALNTGKSQDEEGVPGVAFDYIRKGLRLGTSEMDRLRGSEVKNLLCERKLVLIFDLDHTLINSTRLHDIYAAEMDLGIRAAASKNADDPNLSLFTLQRMQMLTKLRPFVRKFLEEASNMFEMYIYTMGDKAYAIEIAKLLDPANVYFDS